MTESRPPLPIIIDGQEVPFGVLHQTTRTLEDLTQAKPSAVLELYAHATQGKELTIDAVQTLEDWGLVTSGRVHDLTKLIVKDIVTVEAGKPAIHSIFQKKEVTPGFADADAAVAALDLRELKALYIRTQLGKITPANDGYAKVAEFIKDGVPTPELKTSIERAYNKQAGQ